MKKINLRRLLVLILAPIVAFGVYGVIQKNRAKEVQAVDPLTITYHGDETSLPVFTVTNMLPGDEVEEEITVMNNAGSTLAIAARFEKTEEEKEFADILDVEINVNPTVFSGNLEGLFSAGNIFLFNLAPGEDKSFRVKVKFPSLAGNEYQEARVVFDIIFATEITIDLPRECQHLSGSIINIVEGTEGNDRIHGTANGDLILAYGGNDRIDASSSSDCVLGGEGNDKIYSESGDDVVLAGPGNDKVYSGSGNDTVYGGEGNDYIDSGSGNDNVWGGAGNDNIDAGSGNDKVYGEAGEDHIDGESGDDEIWGGDQNDTIRGGAGNDKLYGEGGNDNIRGSSGNDILDGGPDHDTLNGNAGLDDCDNGETLIFCEL